MKTAVDAIITIDARGSVESMNPAAEKLFGYAAEEVLGKNVKMLMPEPYRHEHDGYLHNYLTTGQKKIIGIGREVVGLRKDGSTFPMDLAVSEVKLGQRQLFTGIVRDISDRKKTEEQLRFYADEIQGRNQELLRSNQELDEFAYIASHDLKEPLRGIHNYATFLLEDYKDKLNEDGAAKLETLKRLTQRMDVLLDSLLEFSRVGRHEFAIRPTNLGELVNEVVDSLRIVLDERHDRDSHPPAAADDQLRSRADRRGVSQPDYERDEVQRQGREVDRDRLRHRDDSRSGVGRSAAIRARRSTVIYVRDNGIGIPQKFHDAIFKIFKRLHARDEFGGGTGVGLTIVKKIIERHGGQIGVHSEDNVGTCFYFTLTGTE